VHVCTVITKSWIAHARALAESIRTHSPNSSFAVLIVDPIDGYVSAADEPFEILAIEDLEYEDAEAMITRYDLRTLASVFKPVLMLSELRRHERVVYLDADIRVYGPLDDLEDILAQRPVAITPHLTVPLPRDGRQPDDGAILVAGTYNSGFMAARRGSTAEQALHWWADHLRFEAVLSIAQGVVYDQLWLNLMPDLFADVGSIRDPAWNAAYWNAFGRDFQFDGEQVLIDGRPLRCFHFSGFDPLRKEHLSYFDNRISLAEQPVLRHLCDEFAARLERHGHPETSCWPYGFAATPSGIELTPLLRQLWDRGRAEGALSEWPFSVRGEEEFLAWLAQPQQHDLDRYLTELHRSYPELRERFPDPQGTDRDAYLAWAQEQAELHPNEVLALLRARPGAIRRPEMRDLEPSQTLGAERGEVVVCIPVYGASELFAECLASVLAHTPLDIRIMIADDASPDPAIRTFVTSLEDVLRHDVSYLRQPENLGFPGNVNVAFAAAAPADVVVLNSDCVVAAGWLEGLRRAALSDALVATASALTNHGTILSVPERNRPQSGIPQDQDLAHAAGAVLEQSLRLYPHLPTAIGHCMYIRRQALDLVGGFDLAFSPGYGEEVDFSQRCVLHGLVHVAADDVFVLHHAGGSFGEDGAVNPVQEEHERAIEARYPYYQRATVAASTTSFGRLPRSIASARRAISGLAVTIDGRCLGPFATGTQVHTLQLIKALDTAEQIGLRVIVPPDLGSYAVEEFASRPGIRLIPHTELHPDMEKADVAHRPYQVSNANDLLVLRCAGERQVITHQDLIAYRNPGYFAGFPQWERHRRLTRHALALADRIVFFSHHAARDALSEDLVDPERVRVVYIGVDHAEPPSVDGLQPPENGETLSQGPFLLCLGTDFRHKNRVFALRLLEALRDEQGWNGKLVLAGPRVVGGGSSAGEEATYLATRPELARAVITLPAVSEPEKGWLLEHCAAVLYPTTYEGFGLMPFEAADHDRPCLFASQTALAELLPRELATLVPWDPHESAKRVSDLLARPESMQAHVRAIRRAANPLTWQSTAESLIDVYRAAAASPAREAARMAEELTKVEAERAELERKYNELWQSLTPDARTLVAPDGPLSPTAHRSLAAVVKRPLLRRLLLGPVQLAHRITRLGRHDPPPESPRSSSESFELHFGGANMEHMREQLVSDPEQPVSEP
jgi:GT2 family glycosyltransferase/glycosyltransferase involved in cell wall biosynthesis